MFKRVLGFLPGAGTPARPSATDIPGEEEDEGGLQDMVAEMNETAKGLPTETALKRSLPSDEMTEPPNKRIAIESTSATSQAKLSTPVPPIPKSVSKLKRKQTPHRTPVDRRNPYEIPPDAQAQPQPEPQKQLKPENPVKKTRKLNQPVPHLRMPTVDQAVVSPSTNKNVNFDESPSQVTRRPSRLKPTTLRAQEVPQQEILDTITVSTPGAATSTPKTTNTRRMPQQTQSKSNGETSSRAQRKSNVQNQTKQAEPGSNSKASSTPITQPNKKNPLLGVNFSQPDATPGQPKEKGPRRSPRKAAASQSEVIAKEPPRSSRKTNKTPTTNAGPSNSAPDSNEDSIADETQQTDQPANTDENTTTKTRKEKLSEDEIGRVLRGIEQAVELHNCRDIWVAILEAALNNKRDATAPKCESRIGRAINETLERLRKAYEKIQQADTADIDTIQDEIDNLTSSLKSRFSYISCNEESPENSELGRDLLQHLLPKTISLLRKMLQVLFKDNDLDIPAYQALLKVLRISHMVSTKGIDWKPNDRTLTLGIRKRTRNNIRSRITIMIRRYNDELQKLKRPIDEKLFTDLLQAKQQKDWVRLEDEVQRRRRQILQRRRENYFDSSQHRYEQCEIIDLDDIVLDGSQGPQATGSGLTSRRGFAPRRLIREPTEEIPGPTASKWTNDELIALTNGLQEFMGINRFEDILEKYGGSGDVLSGRDLDELMQQAQYLKRSMAQLLRNIGNDSWKWLQSVPG